MSRHEQTGAESVAALGRKHLVMLSTAGRGGMRSVVDAYERDGVFQRWNVRVLYSHVEGSLTARLLAAMGALLQFSALLAAGRVALLHCHVAMGGSFWRKSAFAELARLFRVPVILHLHGSDMEIFHDAQGLFGRRMIARQLERAARVIVLSGSWREFVQRVAPKSRTQVLFNYVTLPPLSHCNQPHPGVRFLFLGILGRRKGIYDLLPAFRAATGSAAEIRLLVGGNGEEAETREMVRALGLDAVVDVLGWVAGQAKLDLLQTADVFVLPSYNEGLPVGILEAMAYGVPVLSTRVGGIPELVRDGKDGLLIEPGDRAALEQAIVRLGTDQALRARMGLAARERIAASFSGAAVLPELESLYLELIGADKSGKRACQQEHV